MYCNYTAGCYAMCAVTKVQPTFYWSPRHLFAPPSLSLFHITPSRNAHCTYPCKTLGSSTENLYIFPVFTNNLLVVVIIDATIHVIVLSCCSITVLVFSNLMKDQEKKSLSLHCLQWCNSNSANPGKQSCITRSQRLSAECLLLIHTHTTTTGSYVLLVAGYKLFIACNFFPGP